ncbi:MAG: TerB family tellurite resistance protein [Acidobacteriota bacterium]|nr:TerB family tellurite resistance protein [Acidobacteriota bacterium]
MLDRIRSFFGERIDPERSDDPDARLRLAAAALMVEVMRADFDAAEEEKEAVLAGVRRHLGLSEEQTGELVELAESETEGSVCLYEFTRLIHESFDNTRKGRLIEELWRVAFADRVLEAQEEFLIRKIARLLHLPHSDFIAARQRARSRVQEGTGR